LNSRLAASDTQLATLRSQLDQINRDRLRGVSEQLERERQRGNSLAQRGTLDDDDFRGPDRSRGLAQGQGFTGGGNPQGPSAVAPAGPVAPAQAGGGSSLTAPRAQVEAASGGLNRALTAARTEAAGSDILLSSGRITIESARQQSSRTITINDIPGDQFQLIVERRQGVLQDLLTRVQGETSSVVRFELISQDQRRLEVFAVRESDGYKLAFDEAGTVGSGRSIASEQSPETEPPREPAHRLRQVQEMFRRATQEGI
jgi:hypothetical protein